MRDDDVSPHRFGRANLMLIERFAVKAHQGHKNPYATPRYCTKTGGILLAPLGRFDGAFGLFSDFFVGRWLGHDRLL